MSVPSREGHEGEGMEEGVAQKPAGGCLDAIKLLVLQ